jgi:hypothetical protein
VLTMLHPLSAKAGTTLTSDGRSVGIIRSWAKAREFFLFYGYAESVL